MFLGIQWYWWLAIILVLLSIPLKLKFLRWWGNRNEAKEKSGKWGEEE